MTPLDRLRQDETLRRDGIAVLIDLALRQPISTYVDIGVLVDVITTGLGEPLLQRIADEHVAPALARLEGPLDAHPLRGQTAAAMVPVEVLAEAETLVATMELPQFSWLTRAIDPADVRRLLTPVWQEIFSGFASKLTPSLPTSASDSIGGLGKGLAGALSKMGSTVSRGVAKATDGRVKGVVQDFSAGVTTEVKKALFRRLASDEGQEITEKIRRDLFHQIAQTDGAEIWADLRRMPLVKWLRLLPPSVAQAATLPFTRQLLQQEFRAALAIEGDKPAHQLFDEAGTLPVVRAYLRSTGEQLLDELLSDEAFATWLDRWLAPASS